MSEVSKHGKLPVEPGDKLGSSQLPEDHDSVKARNDQIRNRIESLVPGPEAFDKDGPAVGAGGNLNVGGQDNKGVAGGAQKAATKKQEQSFAPPSEVPGAATGEAGPLAPGVFSEPQKPHRTKRKVTVLIGAVAVLVLLGVVGFALTRVFVGGSGFGFLNSAEDSSESESGGTTIEEESTATPTSASEEQANQEESQGEGEEGQSSEEAILDVDGDGLNAAEEEYYTTDPESADTDVMVTMMERKFAQAMIHWVRGNWIQIMMGFLILTKENLAVTLIIQIQMVMVLMMGTRLRMDITH
jgi:hypothetical protein